MNLDWLPMDWQAFPVLGAAVAWVARIHYRVNDNKKANDDFKSALEKHAEEDRVTASVVTETHAKVCAVEQSLTRLEGRMDTLLTKLPTIIKDSINEQRQ